MLNGSTVEFIVRFFSFIETWLKQIQKLKQKNSHLMLPLHTKTLLF